MPDLGEEYYAKVTAPLVLTPEDEEALARLLGWEEKPWECSDS